MVTPGAHGDHYAALGLARGATLEQVERAYHFFAAMYEDTAVAIYSLLEPEQMRDARARVRQAYEVLKDPAQRQQYDASLAESQAREPHPERPAVAATGPRPIFRAAAPRSLTRPAAAAGPPAPAARILSEPVTGECLRKVREERGVSLREIAGATKIGVRFLEYIEGDRHSELPALVYLRGFLQQYARLLGLDPRRTADSYILRLPRG
jgi:flagellar biosynthesis protein FlhG